MTTYDTKTAAPKVGTKCACGGTCDHCAGRNPETTPLGVVSNQAMQRRTLGGDVGPVGQEPHDAGVPGGAPAAPAPAPGGGLTINVVQAAKDLTKCGSAEYKVHWNVPGNSNGWIIQHVEFSNFVTQADGTLVNANNATTEYWEAWQVQNGNVFVGAVGGGAHSADTFRTINEGPGRRGVIFVSGHVAFMPNYALNMPPWGHTVAPAGDLPTVTAAPAGWSDGAALPHWMSVQFDCTEADPANHTQTVTTNP